MKSVLVIFLILFKMIIDYIIHFKFIIHYMSAVLAK